jgi:hypothetical protein
MSITRTNNLLPFSQKKYVLEQIEEAQQMIKLLSEETRPIADEQIERAYQHLTGLYQLVPTHERFLKSYLKGLLHTLGP